MFPTSPTELIATGPKSTDPDYQHAKLSVYASVTIRYCDKTAKYVIEIKCWKHIFVSN